MINSAHNLDEPEYKKNFNKAHFTIAAKKYNFATKGLSLFQDRKWKDLLVKNIPNYPAPNILDLACGTGDICFKLSDKFPNSLITGIDLTPQMLYVAKHTSSNGNISFIEGDIAFLPFSNDSFEIITASYAIRNSPKLLLTLNEVSRTLKSGGTFAILDFSKPDSKISQKVQQFILKFWGGLWGLVLHFNPNVHSYIGKSLSNYPSQSELIKSLTDLKFQIKERHKFMFGNIEIIILSKKIS
jgi:ubiquinone/menaquinone biosynthesis methyltransferase